MNSEKKKVIVILNDLLTQDIISGLLEAQGILATSVSDKTSAVRKANELLPDLLISSVEDIDQSEELINIPAIRVYYDTFIPSDRYLKDIKLPVNINNFSNTIVEVLNSLNNKSSKKYKILIVDDMMFNIEILENILEDSGYTILKATNGIDAIEYVKNEDPDLVLLDIMMSQMGGIEVCKIIKNDLKKHELPVIFITALDQIENKLEGLEVGAVDYITKPFDEREVKARVSSFLKIKQLQDELKLRAIELEEKNKELNSLNNDKNQLLAIVAHDLRNPLGTISSLISLLLYQKDMFNEKQVEVITTINIFCKKMIEMVNTILDLFSIETGKLKIKLEKEDIEHILYSNYRLNEIAAKNKSIELKLDFPDEKLPAIMVDRERIKQALDNLISNAIKFSMPNSTIYLILRRQNNFIEITVKDEGYGIPAEDIDKLFTNCNNSSAKPTTNEFSSGLGLTIVSKIVKLHSGIIKVNSKQGQGSEFIIYLPINEA